MIGPRCRRRFGIVGDGCGVDSAAGALAPRRTGDRMEEKLTEELLDELLSSTEDGVPA